MAITNYGTVLKLICDGNNISARELARRLNLSHTMIGNYLNGNRPIPDDFQAQIHNVCTEFTNQELDRLDAIFGAQTNRIELAKQTPIRRKAIVQLASTAKGLTDSDAAMLAALVHRFSDFPESEKRKIRELVGKDAIEEMMKARNLQGESSRVPFRTSDNIEYAAMVLREKLLLSDTKLIPLLDVLETKLPKVWPEFRHRNRTFSDMYPEEAKANPTMKRIYFRDDVFENLMQMDGRARFTTAHEIGHLCLHCPDTAITYPSKNQSEIGDAEEQADLFAISFLFPRKFANEYSNPSEVMKDFGVSYTAATRALGRYKRRTSYA